MNWGSIGLGGLLIAGGTMTWCALRFVSLHLWRRRQHARESLDELFEAALLESGRLSNFPVPNLSGQYVGYPISIEHGINHRDTPRHLWRIHSKLEAAWPGRVLLHGEERPGNMRALSGLEVVFTQDERFDHALLVASNDPQRAMAVLGTHMRERFLQLPCTHLQIDIHQHSVYAELSSRTGYEHIDLKAFLDVFVQFLGAVDQHVQDTG